MSVPKRPSTFHVPELPRQYISDFGDSSQTTEAALLRLVLDTSASPAAAVVVEGIGGTGKTTSLLGVGFEPSTWSRFSDAVYFISLGRDADPSTLLDDLETVVGAVVGTSEAEEISRLSKRRRNNATAATEAIQHLNDRDVLLLIDDVWADEHACEVGRSTVFFLVQNCLRQVHNNPGRLRIVVSTRDASVARVLPESCHVLAHPFAVGDPLAREILCRYADVSLNEIQMLGSQVRRSFNVLLSRCGGLQLAIAVEGCGVRDRLQSGAEQNDTVWIAYAREISEAGTRLKKTHSDHPGIYVMLQSSLDHLKACLDDDGVALPFDLMMLFSFLAVMKKREAVPLPVLAHIWGLSPEKTLLVCTALARLHLMSVTRGEDGMRRVSMHDLVLDFCLVVLCEKPGRKAYAHLMTVKGLEVVMVSTGIRADMERDGCAAFWKLCDFGLNMDACTRDYFVRNIARHMMEAGGQHIQQLLHLVTDYRWIEARMKRSQTGADLSGILDDIQTLLMGCGEKMDAEVREGLELISDGAQLSMPYVANNPLGLAYQLQGRLIIHEGRNLLVNRLLWSLENYAKRPLLRVGGDVLEAAGGSVVLKVSLPQALHCVAVLPNGEDAVVGGMEGYLVVFSIRYASELYELRGHQDGVLCVAVCAATQRMFSSGEDGTIRVWEIGTGQEGGNILLRHERIVRSLAVTTDGRWLVFGDWDGWLMVCDSISGDLRCKWRGHKKAVNSMAVREQDGMIVSGSSDGTIGRWEVTTGRETGSRIDVGCQISSVSMSRDGKKIAYGGSKLLGVVDASCGNTIRAWSEPDKSAAAWCVTFGSDSDTVHFGTNDGSVAALAPDGSIICTARVHTKPVSAITLLDEGRLLVSVSWGSTLAVQNLERFKSVEAVDPIAGHPEGRLVGAVFKTDDRTRNENICAAPVLPLALKKDAVSSDNRTGMEFKVFISHAGPDKKDVAIPLYERLKERGLRAFVDREQLRVSEEAPEERQDAMDRASVVVFILSPEFAGRRWPLKELMCFLERRRASGRGPKTPALIPVFYRLGVRDCQSSDLYGPRSESGKIVFQQGFFDQRRQAEISTEKAMQAMREVTRFTGIERGEESSVDELVDVIASAVEGVLRRQLRQQVSEGRGREDCGEEMDLTQSTR